MRVHPYRLIIIKCLSDEGKNISKKTDKVNFPHYNLNSKVF